ncbi:hypothetical protein RF11_04308 [Thelohanellus kitauei]|uniref:Uncharacterized protein n=1 Tax=Thelohanellus kitauei TaxID=669202 RepID=A0A0C2N6T8_THEKT|nr:hypothetical protein RF11_04308 [Thelohanellus kitauei]
MTNFIKSMSQSSKSFVSPNMSALLTLIAIRLKSITSGEEGSLSAANITYLETCLRFVRYVFQISSMYSSNIAFNLFSSEHGEFVHFISTTITFIVQKPKHVVQLTDEILFIFIILCYSHFPKSQIKIKLVDFAIQSENESLFESFLYVLTSFSLSSSRPASWMSTIYHSTRYITGLVTLGYLGGGQTEINDHTTYYSQFILNYFLYSHEFSSVAQKFFNKLVIDKVGSETTESVVMSVDVIKIDDIFKKISSDDNELLLILLYGLMRNNSTIKAAFIDSSYSEHLVRVLMIKVMSLCLLLYQNEKHSYYRITTALIILLTLTSESKFVEFLHSKMMAKLSWFQEQYRSDSWSASNVIFFCIIKSLKGNKVFS